MHDTEMPDEDAGALKRYVIWTGVLTIATGLFFVLCPWSDLTTARWFYVGNNQFSMSSSVVGILFRTVFKVVFIAACLVIAAGLIAALFGHRFGSIIPLPVWLFLTCTLVVGPGLIANTVFKDNWGRARPYHMEQFGGDKQFTTAFAISDQCDRNCSFFGGESSAIYALFFALAFSIHGRRRKLIAVGIAAGSCAGLIRMAQGGHFISDVVISGFAMMLVVLALHWLFFIRFRSAFEMTSASPVHTISPIIREEPYALAPIPVALRQQR